MAKKCVVSKILCKKLCFYQETTFKISPNFVFSLFSEEIINLHHYLETWGQAQLSSPIVWKWRQKTGEEGLSILKKFVYFPKKGFLTKMCFKALVSIWEKVHDRI